MKAKRGFTLLEMMVATTIMAIAIVGLLSAIAGATRNAARLRDYDRAVQLARLRMNALLADQTIPIGQMMSGTFDANLTGGLEVGWQARLSTVELPPSPATGQPALQRIELQVWWMAGAERRSFTLDAHRTRILQPGDL
jgi:general secretion pathway protein I